MKIDIILFLFQNARIGLFILPSNVIFCIGAGSKGRPTTQLSNGSWSLSRILRNRVHYFFSILYGFGNRAVCQVKFHYSFIAKGYNWSIYLLKHSNSFGILKITVFRRELPKCKNSSKSCWLHINLETSNINI